MPSLFKIENKNDAYQSVRYIVSLRHITKPNPKYIMFCFSHTTNSLPSLRLRSTNCRTRTTALPRPRRVNRAARQANNKKSINADEILPLPPCTRLSGACLHCQVVRSDYFNSTSPAFIFAFVASYTCSVTVVIASFC